MPLIVIDGIDGAGKSTQIEKLTRRLSQTRARVPICSAEPTQHGYGRKLRDAAKNGGCADIPTELAWFLADRKDHVTRLIRPNLRNNEMVILDRYIPSSMAYQSRSGEFTAAEILNMNLAVAPKWDLLIILDLDAEKAMERLKTRPTAVECYEKLDFLKHCRDTYRAIPGAIIINADADPDTVHVHIAAAVDQCLDFLSYRTGDSL